MRDPSLTGITQGDYLCVGVWGDVVSTDGKNVTLEVERVAAINTDEAEEMAPTPAAEPVEDVEEIAAPTPNPIASMMARKTPKV